MEFPENLSELSVEALTALRTELSAALDAFVSVEAPTADQVTEAATRDEQFTAVDAEFARRTEVTNQAAAIRDRQAARATAAAEATAAAAAEGTEGEAESAEGQAETDEERAAREAAEAESNSGEGTELAAVAAGGNTSTFNRAGISGVRPDAPAARAGRGMTTITAAPDIPNLAHGTKFAHLSDMASAVIDRFEGYVPPAGDGSTSDWRNQSFARISKNLDPKHVVPAGASEEQFWAVVDAVLDDSQLDGGGLVAAGGWCSPSEIAYDLCEGETLDGMYSQPEMGLGRGGLRYTMGPDWSDIFGNGYGVQTETQAIAGVAKTAFEITCPTFVETRLDAIYQFVKVPILTEAAYPELVKRWMRGLVVSYAHKKNERALTLTAGLLTNGGTVVTTGSLAQDLLRFLVNAANYQRQLRRWSLRQAFEIVIPFWVKGAIQADIALRSGRTTAQVSDAEINQIFTAANMLPQWVYDWQPLASNVAYPATFDVLIYKAGTFVAGTNDVIKLDTVYDAASLAQNVYTALFMEEGHNVMRMCQGGTKLTFSSACLNGRTGANDLTCA